MNVYLEFGLSVAWAEIVALLFRRFFWRDMVLPTTIISGLMGGVAGWVFAATLADHLDWLNIASNEFRPFVVGVIVVAFVGGFQRLLSNEEM